MSEQIPYDPGHWRISNVQHRGRTLIVDLLDSLLLARTQEQAGVHARANPNGFTTRDLPMYFAVFRALEKQHQMGIDVSTPVAFIRTSMRKKHLLTLTAVDYSPKGKSVVTYGVGTEKPYQQKVDVVGHDRRIAQKDSARLEALLGIGNVEEINRVFRFINGTPVYLRKVDAKPLEADRRVAGVDADYAKAYLDCGGELWGIYPALGIREVTPLRGARKR